ncbi:hypothetical protein RSPO_c01650 [Ralstonia solanacearum Po82]|uniref:Uncharacterized protein n=1 Tax=Ralstonia solanacearum (strain Po82) TaxID=1031711 RepID=F6G1E6_RALS8|nr:hypothetical protein RSPO_c01650 [Ralstonia solanacearum Po82]
MPVRVRGGHHSVVRRTGQARQSVGWAGCFEAVSAGSSHSIPKRGRKKTRPRPRFHLR